MSDIKPFLLKFLILAAMLLGLPMLGGWVAGYPIARYLEFPPQTRYVIHAPFSWLAFTAIAFSILAVVLPLIVKGSQSYKKTSAPNPRSASHPFPWWGWIGVITGLVSWILAWTRFAWFSAYQPHTFSLLWFSYIVVVNALSCRRTGHCLMTDRSGFFLLLFPVSAAFWWFFEYLNRFAQNWYYAGVEFGPWAYFWYATLPFSTVLPAVQSTEEYLASFSRLAAPLKNWQPVIVHKPAIWGWLLLALAGPSLAWISIYPDYLFPMLWMAPFLVITGVQAICGEETVFRDLPNGDWRAIWLPALAALICGFFWEMWNFKSLAHWQYSVPYVQRFHIFEMPILGYGGYLPFGLGCMVVSRMLDRVLGSEVYSIT